MDPLSLTASIIAVLQMTTSLISYFNGVQRATSDQRKIMVEAASLLSLLTSLRNRVEDAHVEDEWFNHAKLLSVENGPLEQFKHVLEKVVERTAPAASRTRDRVISSLSWSFTKSEVDALFTQMERLKSLIHIALSNDAFKLSQAIHSEVLYLQDGVKQLLTNADRDAQDKLSRWLKIPDTSTNYRAAQSKRHPGTGSWLINSQIFGDWKASRCSLLWLHGKAGCGKTVLSATALEHLLQLKSQLDIAVIYFYFDFNDVGKQRSQTAIRSLLLQLAFQLDNGAQALHQLYQKCDDGRLQPGNDQVQSLLYALIDKSKQKYIVLDALDECQDRDGVLVVLEELVALQHNMCIFVTSRPEREIDESLRPIANQIIDVQSAVVSADIDAYVRGRLSTDKKLKKWSASVKDEIAKQLQDKADGMFRWVYCQLNSLQCCVKLSDLRTALLALPRTLDETYARIIESIDSNGQLQNAVTILRWLCSAYRPLRLSAIVDALAIKNGEDSDNGFSPDERLPDPRDVVTICSGLVSLYTFSESADLESYWHDNESEYDNRSEYNNTEDNSLLPGTTTWVRLAHFSVKEYLFSDRCSLRSDLDSAKCHTAITESCLHYLRHMSQNQILTEEIIEKYPLADYSAELWCIHARDIQTKPPARIVDIVYNSFTDHHVLLVWRRLCDIENPSRGHDLSADFEDLAPSLYYAARTGLAEVAQRLIARGDDVNARGWRLANALQVASIYGCVEVVEVLLKAGANVNAQGGVYGNAIYAAAAADRERVVQILIGAGAKVNQKVGRYGNALQIASARGCEKVVQILIEAWPKPCPPERNSANSQECFDNALWAASFKGHEKVVEMLVKAGAKVEVKGVINNALCAASAEGHEKVVQILVNTWSDINPRGCFNSALREASARKHEKVVKILIEAGAEASAQRERYSEALEVISARDQEKEMQILLQVIEH